MRAKWTFRANDFERVWVNEGDALTATLTPGFAIQAAMPQGTGEGYSVGGRFAIGLAELRVEVVWGHAYLAGRHVAGLHHAARAPQNRQRIQ